MDTTPAARLNAHWCDTVVRSHWIDTATSTTRWMARRRPPSGYPDAITLSPGLSPSVVIADTEPGPGRSVKDSFADLDLTEHGLTVLFTASWIHAQLHNEPAVLPWRRVDHTTGVDRWAGTYRGTALTDRLLGDPQVALMVVEKGERATAAAWFNQTNDGIGVSNVRIFDEDPNTVWADLPRLAPSIGPGPIWGYATDAHLPVTKRAGFATAGPLRIWIHHRTSHTDNRQPTRSSPEELGTQAG